MKNKNAVIVGYKRTAVAKAIKGGLASVNPVDYAAAVVSDLVNSIPEVSPEMIDDVIMGCAAPERKLGSNTARLIALRAGLPYEVSGETINRFCSSGLQSIAIGASAIMTNQMDIVIAGGVEQMTKEMFFFPREYMNDYLVENEPGAYIGNGITAENVAAKYGINREQCDVFAMESNKRAAAAIENGYFKNQIVPIEYEREGEKVVFDTDEGVRAETTMESLGKLKPAFQEGGVVTAGNSSQISDGAGAVMLMSEEKAEELGLKPIARFINFTVAGVDPSYMGIGPVAAIPKLMARTGLTTDDMDVIELNEAFASQALYCIDHLGLDPKKVNPNGGAIALGHPLGATGAILTCKALGELERTNGRYGLISMCIGGGMGAAGIIEMI